MSFDTEMANALSDGKSIASAYHQAQRQTRAATDSTQAGGMTVKVNRKHKIKATTTYTTTDGKVFSRYEDAALHQTALDINLQHALMAAAVETEANWEELEG